MFVILNKKGLYLKQNFKIVFFLNKSNYINDCRGFCFNFPSYISVLRAYLHYKF